MKSSGITLSKGFYLSNLNLRLIQKMMCIASLSVFANQQVRFRNLKNSEIAVKNGFSETVINIFEDTYDYIPILKH